MNQKAQNPGKPIALAFHTTHESTPARPRLDSTPNTHPGPPLAMGFHLVVGVPRSRPRSFGRKTPGLLDQRAKAGVPSETEKKKRAGKPRETRRKKHMKRKNAQPSGKKRKGASNPRETERVIKREKKNGVPSEEEKKRASSPRETGGETEKTHTQTTSYTRWVGTVYRTVGIRAKQRQGKPENRRAW